MSLGNFLLLICIKTDFGLLATIASCASQKNPAGSKQVAKARQGKERPKKSEDASNTLLLQSLFARHHTATGLPAEISRLCRDFMRDNTEISALTALKSLLERHLCSVDGTNAAPAF